VKAWYGKQKVLLVDGDRDRRARIEKMLEERYQVVSALDGEMALEILEKERNFSAIMLQCNLPGVSGFDVMIRLHTSRALAAVPVLAIGRKEDELKALSLGAVSFIYDTTDDLLWVYRMQNLLSTLRVDADFDSMTGLLLRDRFLADARRLFSTGDQKYVMVYLNIERFEVLNDLFGQSTGDQVLRVLGGKLFSIRGKGVAGRLGGDHFAICCTRDSLDTERLRRLGGDVALQLRMKYDLRVCCGIYEIDDSTLPVEQICDRAQMALTAMSKFNGDCVSYYSEEMRRDLLWEQTVAAQMQEALDGGQFQLYLQPIYSLTTERPVSAEALVRWIHPELGIIPPYKFIPIFERNGFITKLDWFVWEEVFRFLARRKQEGLSDISISVNMSRIDIYSGDVCQKLSILVKKYGVDPSLLRIEVTESAYMHDAQQLLETIRKLNAAGFAVMMDDFGSGYSSLNMLMDMPVSTLKVDMRFVRDVGSEERSNCMMSSIVRMAKWLEMTVVAEGVENRTQLDYLRSIGCDRVQGYYYAKPMPIVEFSEKLDDYAKLSTGDCDAEGCDEEIDLEGIWNAIMDSERLLGERIGAVGIYELAGDTVEILQVNDTYYKTMETTPEAMFRDTQGALAWLRKEDRAPLRRALDAARETGRVQEVVVGRYMNSERVKHLLCSVGYLGRKDNRFIYIFFSRDVSGLDCSLSIQMTEYSPNQESEDGANGRHKILIVEDNQVNRLMLRKILSEDYDVLEAQNGQEGLDLLGRQNISAVLLDIIMPIVDGYEFLRRKAADPELREIPVMVLSQTETLEGQEKAKELGACGFIRKPYEPAKLKQQLNKLINQIEGVPL